MKRFFAKLGRFFWSWGFLKFILGMIVLIIFIYVEEDWRGARDWAATKAGWEAKGESFDYNKFIPPPVPDDQNLAALPLFKLEPVKQDDGSSFLEPVALKLALRSDFPAIDFPPLGGRQPGELPDMAKFQNVFASNYSLVFKGAKPPGNTLAQFNAIYPFLSDLLTESVNRPFCRFQQDYAIQPPWNRPLGLLTYQIKLSRILTLHAILALQNHQPNLALDDIELNLRLLAGVKQDPSLVAGLVAIGISAIDRAAIYDGLALHAWNDAQLAGLQDELARVDFLSGYQFALRGEVAGFTVPTSEYMKHSPSILFNVFNNTAPSSTEITPTLPSIISKIIFSDGWIDQNEIQIINAYFRSIRSFDPNSHRVYPTISDQVFEQAQRDKHKFTALAPWNFFYLVSAGPVLSAAPKFAQAQVWVDEMRIACALERYHLAHNSYPDSFDALVPACIAELPNDIINGQPYHYRLRPDGTFLLYSVGWNQIDDGGVVVYQKDAPNLVDYKQGDWVWPTVQPAPAK